MSRVLTLAVAVAALLLAGVVGWLVLGAGSGDSAAADIAGLKSYDGLARDHVDGDLTYPGNPPVGGDHNPVWQNCGWYDTELRNENAVHTLEHGAVWIAYRPDLGDADRAELKSELAGQAYVLASPYPGLDGPVVATAWGKQVVLDSVTDPRLQQFIDQFADSANAPERGARCDGGVGDPS